jgi:hypothetical protein
MIDPGPAVRAAVTVAAAHGLSRTEPIVVRNGSNVLVHLAPTPVVARIGSLTARVRPDVTATLAKDLAVAGYLADRGAPVAAPSRELPVGPHECDGHSLTFWTYVEHERDHVWQPADIGPLLAELHAELRDFPGELPTAPPLDVPETLAFLACEPLLSDDDTAALFEEAAVLTDTLAHLAPAVPLHGDAHPGNLMYTANGPVWTDFEDAWRGPIGWDLACLAETNRLDGRAAVAGYPGAPGARDLAPCVAGRQLQTIGWGLVFLRCFPDATKHAGMVQRLADWRKTR